MTVSLSSFFWFVLIYYSVASACFAAYIANQKDRNEIGWFAWGLLFGVIAILSLIALPNGTDDKPIDDLKTRRGW